MYRYFLVCVVCVQFACVKKQPRISNFDSQEAVRGVAYAHGKEGSKGYYQHKNDLTPVIDSVIFTRKNAQSTVWELNRGEHYVQKWETGPQGVLCHIPRFTLRFFNEEGQQTNYFSFCDKCFNARVTNYARYPKTDWFVLSESGLRDIFSIRDRLFPDIQK